MFAVSLVASLAVGFGFGGFVAESDGGPASVCLPGLSGLPMVCQFWYQDPLGAPLCFFAWLDVDGDSSYNEPPDILLYDSFC